MGWAHTGGLPERRRSLLTPGRCARRRRPDLRRAHAARVRRGRRAAARPRRAAGGVRPGGGRGRTAGRVRRRRPVRGPGRRDLPGSRARHGPRRGRLVRGSRRRGAAQRRLPAHRRRHHAGSRRRARPSSTRCTARPERTGRHRPRRPGTLAVPSEERVRSCTRFSERPRGSGSCCHRGHDTTGQRHRRRRDRAQADDMADAQRHDRVGSRRVRHDRRGDGAGRTARARRSTPRCRPTSRLCAGSWPRCRAPGWARRRPPSPALMVALGRRRPRAQRGAARHRARRSRGRGGRTSSRRTPSTPGCPPSARRWADRRRRKERRSDPWARSRWRSRRWRRRARTSWVRRRGSRRGSTTCAGPWSRSRPTWEGQAAQEYRGRQRQWDVAAADLTRVLADVGRALGEAEAGYRAAEAANANLWRAR